MAGSPGWALVLKEKVPFFVLALASSVITFAVQRAGGAMAPLRVIPLHERIANACLSYAIYLRKMVWPADLAVFYPFKHHLPAWQWSGAALLIVALSAVALFSRTKRPYLAMGWFWYLGTLTPVIGLVQVGEQAMADRYAYLPLIGIFVILAWGANELASIWQVKPAALKLAAAAVLTLCLCLTARQAGYWKNSRTLFTHALAVTTDNPVAHANLGEALDKQGKTLEAKEQFLEALKIDPESVSTLTGLGVLNAHSGEIGAAIEYFRAALKRNPSSSDAHYGLGNALAGQGKFAEAAAEFEAAIRSKPDSADAYNNLGVMEFRQGLTTKAIDHFEAALRVDPDFPDAHSQLGSLLMQLGHPDAAISHFEEAVRLSPNFVPTRLKLGVALGQKRRLDAAIAQFSEALKLDPTNIAACYNLAAACAANNQLEAATQYFARAASLDPQDAELQGRLAAVLAVQGRAREAVIAYQAALRLNPDWPVALRDLAWLLATNPDPSIRNGAEAVKLAEHANALAKTPDPRLLEALDAAYAEAGRFEDAIRTAEKVRDLAAAAKEQDVAVHAAQRIALYKAGKPYHEGQPLR